MPAKAILRGAAALFLSLAAVSTAAAGHRAAHAPIYKGAEPGMHAGAYRHGGPMRPPHHFGMHRRHHYGHAGHPGHRIHPGGYHRHHSHRHYGGYAGRPAFFPRPAYRHDNRHHGPRHHAGYGDFLRPRLRRPYFQGGYGLYRKPRYGLGYGYGMPAFARPAYHPYGGGASYGYAAPSYGAASFSYYPTSSLGVVSGGSLSAPLYNRPACVCY